MIVNAHILAEWTKVLITGIIIIAFKKASRKKLNDCDLDKYLFIHSLVGQA